MLLSKPYVLTTWLIATLTALAAAGGLFIPTLYQDSDALIPILQGQDLITLLVAPILVITALDAHRGSSRSLLIYIGLLAYILYTYIGAAFAYHFNKFILVYIALFSLSLFTLIAVLGEIDAEEIRLQFDAAAPRNPVIAFLVLTAIALGFGELAQLVSFYITGDLPQAMQQIDVKSYFVYTLDLGVIVPLCVLASVWLWFDKAWAYVLASCLLIKAATMGLALLAMTWFALRAGQATDGLTMLWAAIAFGGLGFSIWMLGHCLPHSKVKLLQGSTTHG